MKTNTIQNKRVFKITLYSSCPIFGKLKFDKENKGYLKYYDKDMIKERKKFGLSDEIQVDLSNYNKLIIQSIIKQAEIICSMKNSTLWSY